MMYRGVSHVSSPTVQPLNLLALAPVIGTALPLRA
jgi:hypothetical protein